MKLPNFSATFYSLTTFLLGLKGVDLIKWEVSHGTISPAKAAYLRESLGQVHFSTLVHSLGSMNLSPMILVPDDSFKPSKKVVKQ